MNSLDHRIPPPLVFLVVGVAMWLASDPTRGIALDWGVRIATASVLAVAGIGFAVAGRREFQRAGTTINPVAIEKASHLVTSGVFAYTRNPMYLGMTVVLLGLAVWLADAWVLIGPAAFALYINRFQIGPEEVVMRAKFGAAYEQYCSRVRRWL